MSDPAVTEVERVLILDDDTLVGRVILSHVNAIGHQGRFTADPHEFLELQRTWRPSRVIVDLVMDTMDGLEVLEHLAADGCEAAVIISSGMGSRVMDAARRLADAKGLTIAGTLAKPYTRADLSALLRSTPMGSTARASQSVAAQPWWTVEQFPAAFERALKQGHIGVAYQPKVNCQELEVVGFEALVRWTDPERGNLPPADFVPMAEAAGMVSRLTDTVMAQALAWFATQPLADNQHLSINISAAELSEPELDQRLMRTCRNAGVSTDRVILELTETSAMEDPVLSLQLLTRLRLEGFRVSLDDFGTGYSSMLQLARMPFSELKLDQSFVMNATRSDEELIVIRSSIDLGHALGMECTAEGVEDVETLDLLRALGCDYAQGYHIARPLFAEELRTWKYPAA